MRKLAFQLGNGRRLEAPNQDSVLISNTIGEWQRRQRPSLYGNMDEGLRLGKETPLKPPARR